MNSIVVTSTKQNIKFGYEGEDNVTKIIFPYDESWLEYGEGNFEVRILRCGDEVAYTATDIVDDRQAMTLTMTVTDIELSVRGRGEMQLCYVCPDSIKKSPIYQYTVNRSVDYKYAVDPPEGSIIASVEKSLSEIKNTTNRLSNSVISIESSIDDVNSQIDNINDKISEFDEEIDSIGEVETRVDNLETSIQSINGRINTAEGNINENTESISDLNESVTELENRKVTDLETSGGRSDSGKYLTVGTDGKIKATSLTIPPTITVDASLSTTSTNPVQNKVIKTELNNINSNIETCNTEISKINGSLDTLKADLGKYTDTPVLTQDDVVTGGYINGTNGFKVDGQSYVCTDFIEIPSDAVGLLLSSNCFFGSVIGYAFYASKSSNSFISGGTGTGWTVKPISVVIPDGAKYFRTSLEASGYTDPSDFGISYQRRISEIDEVSFVDYGQWEQGSIDSTTGSISSRNDRILDRNYYDVSKIESVLSAEGFQILCASYSTTDISGFIGLSSWTNYHTSFSGAYMRFAVRKSSGADISPNEDTGFELRYKSQSVNEILAEQDAEIKATHETAEKSLAALGALPYSAGSKNQIARLGWNVYSTDTPPEQTPQAYALAYKNGCRIMLGDIRVTSDGKYVLWHDETLNNSVKHTDGTNLSTAEKAMTIAGSTLEELNAFDYGIYKGQKYVGMKMPMLDDLLKWCALTNCIPMLEVKVQLSESDCIEISSMCKRYGLWDRVIIDEYYSCLQNTVDYWKTNLPKCTICIIAWGDVVTARNFINANLINTDISVLLTVSTTSQFYLISTNGVLDYSKVKTVTDLGAKLTYTEVSTSADMDTLYDGGYLNVFSYVASGYIRVNEWIADKLLLN